MLKNNLELNVKNEEINFDDLDLGATFIIELENGTRFIGMKVSDIDEVDFAIVDLSSNIGYYYTGIENYNIVELIDLEIVRGE